MHVYPINMLLNSSLEATSIDPFYDINSLKDGYLYHRIYFLSNQSTISIGDIWSNSATPTSLFLKNTNAISANLFIEGSHYKTYTLEDNDGEKILYLDDQMPPFHNISLILTANDLLYISGIFIAKRIELPRFITEPEMGTQFSGEVRRTFSGQNIGISGGSLDFYNVQFKRLDSFQISLIKTYITAAGNDIAHIIDLYPEARDKFPLIYGTLNMEEVSMIKRAENGFFYDNVSLQFLESK